MSTHKQSFIRQFGAVVLAVEICVLVSLGLFYIELFSNQIDRNAQNEMRVLGELLNRQLLRYETIADREIMTKIIGEEFEDGMIVGADRRIYYSLDPTRVGKRIDKIESIATELFKQENKQHAITSFDHGHSVRFSITPLVAFEGAKPFFYVYIKSSIQEAEDLKIKITLLFIVGSAICIFLTSIAIIGYARKNVTQPLSILTHGAHALEEGQLDVDIPINREDEIGRLADSFIAMRDSIAATISELEHANAIVTQREQQLDALIKAMPDLLLVLNSDGQYLEIFTSNENLLPRDATDLKGKYLRDVLPEETANRFLQTIHQTIETGHVMSLEYELDVLSGANWFEARVARIESDSDQPECVWFIRDITEHKLMENHLRTSKDEAEKANLRLQELDQIKSALVASVSHELRTPLTSLVGFSKLTLKNFSKNFRPLAKSDPKLSAKSSQIMKNLGILIHEGARLTRLINDVLDLNKIEMGYTEWREEKVKPRTLIKKAINAVSGHFKTHTTLDIEQKIESGLPDILVDADKMHQVLLNLLTNAAKFTDEGSVTVRAHSPNAKIVRIEVEDTGPGINKDEQKLIFDSFHQAGHTDPAADKPRGAGLGLAISREIISHHNGTIWVESSPGHGANFIIELPSAS